MTEKRHVTLKELRAFSRETRQQVGKSVSLFDLTNIFHRPISHCFTKLFLMAGISADTITMVSYLLVVVAGAFFIFGNYWYSLIGIAIYQLFIILDCSDGDVSRYTHGVNKNARGAFLEYFGHSVFEPYIIVCVTFSLYNNPYSLFLGSLFYQNPVVFIIGFVGSNLYLALHILDRLSKSDSSQVVVGEVSTPAEVKTGLLRYPLTILGRFRALTKEYGFADPLLLVTTVSNTLWLYLILWSIIQSALVLVNSVASYRSLPKPQVLEQATESEKTELESGS